MSDEWAGLPQSQSQPLMVARAAEGEFCGDKMCVPGVRRGGGRKNIFDRILKRRSSGRPYTTGPGGSTPSQPFLKVTLETGQNHRHGQICMKKAGKAGDIQKTGERRRDIKRGRLHQRLHRSSDVKEKKGSQKSTADQGKGKMETLLGLAIKAQQSRHRRCQPRQNLHRQKKSEKRMGQAR